MMIFNKVLEVLEQMEGSPASQITKESITPSSPVRDKGDGLEIRARGLNPPGGGDEALNLSVPEGRGFPSGTGRRLIGA